MFIYKLHLYKKNFKLKNTSVFAKLYPAQPFTGWAGLVLTL
jgi:hypothetical protein